MAEILGSINKRLKEKLISPVHFFYTVFCVHYILRNKVSFSTVQKVRYIVNLECTYMYSDSIL